MALFTKKNIKKGLFHFFLMLSILGCVNNTNKIAGETTQETITINGPAFLQPIDKELSLALAPHTYIIIDFLDSMYCNIEHHGYRKLKTSRKYSIDKANTIEIINPVNDKVRNYKLITESDALYLGTANNIKLYKILSADTLNTYLNSNELRKAAFLYPTLDEKERAFGAEDRHVLTEGGILKSFKHPLKSKVRRINIFTLF